MEAEVLVNEVLEPEQLLVLLGFVATVMVFNSPI